MHVSKSLFRISITIVKYIKKRQSAGATASDNPPKLSEIRSKARMTKSWPRMDRRHFFKHHCSVGTSSISASVDARTDFLSGLISLGPYEMVGIDIDLRGTGSFQSRQIMIL